jgi:hypothetical protein
MLSTLAKKRTLLAKSRLVDPAPDWRMDRPAARSRAPSLVRHGEMKMKRLMILALAAALAAPAAVDAQPARAALAAQPATSIALNCDSGAAAAGGEAPNLHGHWDFLMVPRGMASFGLMSIGFVGADYGGSLAPARTAPVVLRQISLTGNAIQMVVASREGDVRFDGRLSAKGDLMCGTVTYHGGETFPMVAQKRPSTYQSPPQAQRAR